MGKQMAAIKDVMRECGGVMRAMRRAKRGEMSFKVALVYAQRQAEYIAVLAESYRDLPIDPPEPTPGPIATTDVPDPINPLWGAPGETQLKADSGKPGKVKKATA